MALSSSVSEVSRLYLRTSNSSPNASANSWTSAIHESSPHRCTSSAFTPGGQQQNCPSPQPHSANNNNKGLFRNKLRPLCIWKNLRVKLKLFFRLEWSSPLGFGHHSLFCVRNRLARTDTDYENVTHQEGLWSTPSPAESLASSESHQWSPPRLTNKRTIEYHSTLDINIYCINRLITTWHDINSPKT